MSAGHHWCRLRRGANFRFKELKGKKPETSCATDSTAVACEISQPGMMRVNKCKL